MHEEATRNALCDKSPTPRELELTRNVSRAIRRAQRNFPYPAKCLPEALAARNMLDRYGIASDLHIGVRAKDQAGGRETFHAWLTVGSYLVAGLGDTQDYLELLPLP